MRWSLLVADDSEPDEGPPAKQRSRAKRRGRVVEMFRVWRDTVQMHQDLTRRLTTELTRVPRDEERVEQARVAVDRFEDALVELREEGAGLRTLRDLLAPKEQAKLSLFVETLRVILATWDLSNHSTFAQFIASRPPNTKAVIRRLAPVLGVGTARLDGVLHSKEVEERLGQGAKKAAMLVAAVLLDRSESTIDRQLREEHGDTRIRARIIVWPPDQDEEAAATEIAKADRRRQHARARSRTEGLTGGSRQPPED
jgi:hypothetical protein